LHDALEATHQHHQHTSDQVACSYMRNAVQHEGTKGYQQHSHIVNIKFATPFGPRFSELVHS